MIGFSEVKPKKMECLSCSESLAVRLDCCPDKLVCNQCRKDKSEIKCPDCGTVSLPSDDKFLSEYLTRKFQKLLSEIQKLEAAYNQTIWTQKKYLNEANSTISNYKKTSVIIHVNLKPVELALDLNESFRTQLESMRNIMSLSPSLTLFGAYPKIKCRIKDWPLPVTVDLHPIRVRETSILSEEGEWLTCVIQRDLISRYTRIQKKQPIRTLEYSDLREINIVKNSYNAREVYEGYFYISNHFANGMFLWDPQGGKVIFNYSGEYQSSQWNGRWIGLLIQGYIYFKKIGTVNSLTRINLHGVTNEKWELFRDFILVEIAGNLIRISLNNPDSFSVIDTKVKDVFNGHISTKVEGGNLILNSYNIATGQSVYTCRVPEQKITTVSSSILLLTTSQKILVDNNLLDLPPELIQDYHHLTSSGEILTVERLNRTYTFRFY